MLKTAARPPLLDRFGQRIARELSKNDPAPLLDAILPLREYTEEQLRRGGFLDDVLTAAVKAWAKIEKAAEDLRPLGISRADLCILLQKRMDERLKVQKKTRKKTARA